MTDVHRTLTLYGDFTILGILSDTPLTPTYFIVLH